MFTLDERVELIRKVVKDLPNVEVDGSNELLAEYAKRRGSCVIIKGLRAGSDFENEFTMAMTGFPSIIAGTVTTGSFPV